MADEAPALRAVKLAGKWARVAQGHVGLSGLPCSCGLGFVGIGVAEFEQHLLDYLHDKHGSDARIAALFQAAGYAEGRSGSVGELLRRLAVLSLPAGQVGALLADLERSMDSFETAHGGKARPT